MYTGAPVADAKVQEDYLTGKEKKLEVDKEDVMRVLIIPFCDPNDGRDLLYSVVPHHINCMV
jgi:hypothetical protein